MASVVMDYGSYLSRIGFAGEDLPCSVFPTAVNGSTPPIEHGFVTNWDRMEELWHYAFFNLLRASPEEHATLLIDSSATGPKITRERITQTLFESFCVPSLLVAPHGSLALLSTGRTTGIVLEMGEGVTKIVPVYEGYSLSMASRSSHSLTGSRLTDWMQKLLADRGLVVGRHEVARDIKEKLAYVALEYAGESRCACSSPAGFEKQYELPDGNSITVGAERFRCGEALFLPELTGDTLDPSGVHTHLHSAIMNCDIDIRRDMFTNIVLSGGTSLLAGLPERLARDTTALAPPGARVVIVAPPKRQHAPWIGGSMLAVTPSYQNFWITKEEYDEAGPSIVHRKCFL
eukprot:TRINITY_DN8907_c0_g1_i1.p1 TRINITY_DN8907_c0_g1~~TRINITY_DN8907_c0_g1_i1.p1  ORF type:complete len:355 (-),score=47.96 TRINITY_DN8907_c0_g1_i1:109-1146(-)